MSIQQSIAIIKENKDSIVEKTDAWIKKTYPFSSQDNQHRTEDLKYILNSILYCLEDNTLIPMDNVARIFFDSGRLQLKYLHIEFECYNFILNCIQDLINDQQTIYLCTDAISKFKKNLNDGMTSNNDEIPRTVDYETRIKHMIYSWDDEQKTMLSMQECQRNWDLSKTISPQVVDYLLWIAQNAPSKQHEAYYDVYYSTDRETIEYLYQFSWGSTHRKNPPAMWRNSQMNANLYMIFVCKQPPTMFNCNNDGTLQNAFGESRWENSIVSVGMAMSLVMRAAHRMGYKTGPNKVKDLGPDYEYEWEKTLGIYDDVKAGTKRLFFGLGIGFPNEGRPRWESDDTEIAIGASNGHHVSIKHRDADWNPLTKNGKEKRKIDIYDVKEYGGQTLTDPYGKKQFIPTEHEIKINTAYTRDIKCIEIVKNTQER